jgi:hypothetical protein
MKKKYFLFFILIYKNKKYFKNIILNLKKKIFEIKKIILANTPLVCYNFIYLFFIKCNAKGAN